MKYSFLLLCCLSMLLSCNSREVVPMTEAQKKALVDSIVRERAKEIRELEEEHLQDMMSLELKIRTDSLLALKRPQSAGTNLPDSSLADGKATDTLNSGADSLSKQNNGL